MCTIAGEGGAVDGKVCCLPRELQYQYERGKISCRRLEWEGGAVSSRVALLLRSAEAQPYLPRFVWFIQTFSFFLLALNVRSRLPLCLSVSLSLSLCVSLSLSLVLLLKETGAGPGSIFSHHRPRQLDATSSHLPTWLATVGCPAMNDQEVDGFG